MSSNEIKHKYTFSKHTANNRQKLFIKYALHIKIIILKLAYNIHKLKLYSDSSNLGPRSKQEMIHKFIKLI